MFWLNLRMGTCQNKNWQSLGVPEGSQVAPKTEVDLWGRPGMVLGGPWAAAPHFVFGPWRVWRVQRNEIRAPPEMTQLLESILGSIVVFFFPKTDTVFVPSIKVASFMVGKYKRIQRSMRKCCKHTMPTV